jgi:hypothetical protein
VEAWRATAALAPAALAPADSRKSRRRKKIDSVENKKLCSFAVCVHTAGVCVSHVLLAPDGSTHRRCEPNTAIDKQATQSTVANVGAARLNQTVATITTFNTCHRRATPCTFLQTANNAQPTTLHVGHFAQNSPRSLPSSMVHNCQTHDNEQSTALYRKVCSHRSSNIL